MTRVLSFSITQVPEKKSNLHVARSGVHVEHFSKTSNGNSGGFQGLSFFTVIGSRMSNPILKALFSGPIQPGMPDRYRLYAHFRLGVRPAPTGRPGAFPAAPFCT
jgi:hypothetical protein